jgi:hypothetical protein
VITLLIGYTSAETAYQHRGQAGRVVRAWIETVGRQQRYVTQTGHATQTGGIVWRPAQPRRFARLWVMYLHTLTRHLDAEALVQGDPLTVIDAFAERYHAGLQDGYSVAALEELRRHAGRANLD